MAIEEHRHCEDCGKVVYATRRRVKGGEIYFPAFCDGCLASFDRAKEPQSTD